MDVTRRWRGGVLYCRLVRGRLLRVQRHHGARPTKRNRNDERSECLKLQVRPVRHGGLHLDDKLQHGTWLFYKAAGLGDIADTTATKRLMTQWSIPTKNDGFLVGNRRFECSLQIEHTEILPA